MNTVDALKDLYKTLCGKDYAGDPNPTDAEMIKAIAKDASTGGSGGSGGSRIEMRVNMGNGNVDPLPAGLELSDFIGSIMVIQNGETAVGYAPTTGIINNAAQGRITILVPNIFLSLEEYVPPVSLDYYPATGEVMTRQS